MLTLIRKMGVALFQAEQTSEQRKLSGIKRRALHNEKGVSSLGRYNYL